jgi:hypothetical protein
LEGHKIWLETREIRSVPWTNFPVRTAYLIARAIVASRIRPITNSSSALSDSLDLKTLISLGRGSTLRFCSHQGKSEK